MIDKIVHSTIRMHLAENIYFSMAKETTTFKLWEMLQAVYEKQSSSSKLILIRKLFNMKMRETNPATSHINTFSWVLSQLSSQGINFEEEVKALTLLSSLPEIDRFNCSRKQAERTGRNSSRPRHWEDRQHSKSRDSRSTIFCTHWETGPSRWDRTSLEKETGLDGFKRIPAGSGVNQKWGHISKYVLCDY